VEKPEIREILTEALAYWERKRILYNVALALVAVTGHLTSTAPWKPSVGFDLFLGLFFLAVIANVLYCAAYLPDVVIHISDFRDRRHVIRTLLFTIGTLFAAGIAFSIAHPAA
jgi:hypothetical protein